MVKTRKSLWAAGFALLVCILLLIGTTFAWFTDSVSNSGNKIQAGNLSIALLQKTDTMSDAQADAARDAGIDVSGEYTDISDVLVPIFDYTLWEPGYTDFKVLGVKNTGTLALKYRLDIIANGEVGTLADVIDVYVKMSNEPIEDEISGFEDISAENGYRNAGTLSSLMNDNDGAAYGELYPIGTEGQQNQAYVAVALHMQEGAGNDYQNESIGTTFDINLSATQMTYEKDGFDNDKYDEDATLNMVVSDQAELLEALEYLGDGSRLTLGRDLSVNGEDVDIRSKENVHIDFNNKTANIDNNNISIRVNGTSEKRASAVLNNGTLIAGDGTYCTIGSGYSDVVLNNMILKNTTAYGCSVKSFPGGQITLNNITSTSELGGGMTAAGGIINVNGGNFTQSGPYDHNSCLGSVSQGKGGSFGVLNVRNMVGESENYGFYVFSSGGTINIYSGNFSAGKAVLKADLDLSSYPGAKGIINVYGGTFDGRIEINDKCALNIKAGTFSNTGLTEEKFKKYVAEGSKVTVVNDVFTVND